MQGASRVASADCRVSDLQVSPRPGGPSAKTFHQAGSPNHQNDSKENSMVEAFEVKGGAR